MRETGHNAGPARVAGVDLAAEAAGTALAVLRVEPAAASATGAADATGATGTTGATGASGPAAAGGATGAAVVLESLLLGVDDDTIVQSTRDAQLIGIDCAFGWPVDFVEFVARHGAGPTRDASPMVAAPAAAPVAATVPVPVPATVAARAPSSAALAPSSAAALAPLGIPATGDLAWRRRLAYRETDRVVTERTGARPLSVATDRLGMTALRCAVLLDRLAGDGRVVDRSGEHPSAVVEVYPAMALRVWGLARPGYKATPDARLALIADLERAAPWLQLGKHRGLMHRSADALDAVLAALVALAHARGASIRPAPDQGERARVEGWIAIPTVDLAQLGALA